VRYGCAAMTEKEPSLLDLAQSFLYPNYRPAPFVLVRGRGCEVWDDRGQRYLDLCAGIAVNTLGHAHPRLVAAIAEQAGRMLHVSNYFYNEPNVRLAAQLCQRTGLARAFFCNSGTEANEAMLKLARRHFHAQGQPDRHRVVAFHHAFHGRTLGALAVTGTPEYRIGYGPLTGATHVEYGDAAAVRQAMGPDVAAILVEPIQGEGGVLPAPAGFLAELRVIADQHGALLLVDEVQTGIGRSGRFLALEHSGVRPDAVTLAKGLAGGVPVGAMLCGSHLAGALPPGSHGCTFGGNPLASAAALAVLDVLQTEGLLAAAEERGAQLARGLGDLAKRHCSRVECARGVGLLQALVLREASDATAALGALRDAGVLLTIAGGRGLRFSPPLVISPAEIDEGVAAVDKVLKALS
jgi:acetylornithine/N-succinyldiaminopimelate aminotransferase